MKKEFAYRLRTVRGERTKQAFAKSLGIPQNSYLRYEDPNDKTLPKVDIVRKIVSLCGVSADWLLGLSDQMHTDQHATPMPQAGLSAADPREGTYLESHPPPARCPRCEALQAQVDKLVDTLHNLSVGRSQPAPRRDAAEPAKY